MANPQIVQFSDFIIQFNVGTFQLSGQPVNLASIQDLVFAVAEGYVFAQPVVKKLYSVVPVDFTIDAANNIVKVVVRTSEIGNQPGSYFCNLWIVQNNEHLGVPPQAFDMIAAVGY